jgi:hypothetical protein
MTELQNPRDATLDVARAKELGATVDTTREALHEAGDRLRQTRAEAKHLQVPRQEQTQRTLALTSSRGVSPVELPAENVVQAQLRQLARTQFAKRQARPLAIEEVASLGFLSPHLVPLDDRQEAMARELSRSSDFVRDQLLQITHANVVTQKPLEEIAVQEQQQQQNNNAKEGGTQVKLSLAFGDFNYSFGYQRRASNDHRKNLFVAHDTDRRLKLAQFYVADPLDETLPLGAPPQSFKLFQRLWAEHGAKFLARETTPLHTALVPRPDLELVPRAHLLKYRMAPVAGQEKCCNGTRCRFYTFLLAKDASLAYVGAAFYTPLEELQDMVVEKPCIDCLLADWTIRVMNNCAKSIAQTTPINHFEVMVGDGEYSQACLLDVTKNKLETGIVGCVPRYDAKFRDVLERKRDRQDLLPESYLGEVGMDF